MPYGYNSLNDTEIDDMKIGLCPICNKRLTAECGHSTTIESQEWLAAHIVAEQELYNERHPADVAQEIESRIDAELFLQAAQEPTQPIFTNDPNCTHEKAYAIIGGMMCKCGAKFQPRNEFEQRLVNSRSPRSSGYVNWQFR